MKMGRPYRAFRSAANDFDSGVNKNGADEGDDMRQWSGSDLEGGSISAPSFLVCQPNEHATQKSCRSSGIISAN